MPVLPEGLQARAQLGARPLELLLATIALRPQADLLVRQHSCAPLSHLLLRLQLELVELGTQYLLGSLFILELAALFLASHHQPGRLMDDANGGFHFVDVLAAGPARAHCRDFKIFLVELDIDLVVSLGALLADVPHTRPCPVSGSASDPELVERLGLSASRYEGPTGIVGVLHDACRQADIHSASLWAAVPHYVSLTPSPKAALALCERLGELLGADIDTTELAEAAENYSEQVSEAVASDPDTAAYIEELEQRADTLAEEAELPSGDALAAELTRFLRERERENGDDYASEQ